MATVAELLVRLSVNLTDFRDGMNDSRRKLDELRDRAESATRGFGELSAGLTAAGGAIALGLGGSVKTAMEFEAQMSKVSALSRATGKDFQDLRQSAIDLGAASVFSASEAAEGMQNLAAAGFNTRQILDAMPGVLDAAAASGESFANVSDIMITAMNGFGLKAKDMSHIADVLAGAANDSSISISQIGLSLKYVAPVAAKANQSIETISAALAILGNAGIKADMAGTALRMGFTRLADPPKEAAAAISQLGIKLTDATGKFLPMAAILDQLHEKYKTLSQAQQLQKTSTIFGTEAMSAWMTLIDKGGASIDGLAGKYRTMAGAAADTAKIMTDNLKGAWNQLSGALESASISIGSALIPSIRALAEGVTVLVNRFNALPEPMKQFLTVGAAVSSAVLLVSGALAGVVALVPTFITGWGAMVGAIAAITSPMGLAAAGIAAAGVVITKFARENDDVRAAVSSAWGSIKAAALEVWPWVSEIVSATAKTVADVWRAASPAIAAVVVAAFETVGNVVTTAMGIIKGAVQVGLAAVVGIGQTMMAVFHGDWAGAWTAVKEMAAGVWAGMKTAFGSAVAGLIGQANIMGTAIISAVQGLVTGVSQWMGAKLTAILDKAGQKVKAAAAPFQWLYDVVVGHSYIPDMVDQVGSHMARLDHNLVHHAKKHTSEAAKHFAKLKRDVAEIMASLSGKIQEAAIEFRVTGDKAGLFRDQMNAAAEAMRSGFKRGLAETSPLMQQARALYASAAQGLKELDASMQPVTGAYVDYGAALVGTQQKLEELTTRQRLFGDEGDIAKQKVDLLREQLVKATITYGDHSDEVARVREQLRGAQADYAGTAKAVQESAKNWSLSLGELKISANDMGRIVTAVFNGASDAVKGFTDWMVAAGVASTEQAKKIGDNLKGMAASMEGILNAASRGDTVGVMLAAGSGIVKGLSGLPEHINMLASTPNGFTPAEWQQAQPYAQKGQQVVINVTGNTILNERDANALGQAIIRAAASRGVQFA